MVVDKLGSCGVVGHALRTSRYDGLARLRFWLLAQTEHGCVHMAAAVLIAAIGQLLRYAGAADRDSCSWSWPAGATKHSINAGNVGHATPRHLRQQSQRLAMPFVTRQPSRHPL